MKIEGSKSEILRQDYVVVFQVRAYFLNGPGRILARAVNVIIVIM